MNNMILDTDSYKASHYLQYPEDTSGVFAYMEARKSSFDDHVLFFGLQYVLKAYLSQPITMAMVEEARDVLTRHGEPFNEAGWKRIVEVHDGYLPVRINAVPEGSRIPLGDVLATFESTDPQCWWVVSWLETQLMRVWYPTTVASISYQCKQIIRNYLELTSDDPSQIDFKLHDFGSRGVSSRESAGIGGLAHLVNFKGTDTVQALLFGRDYYDAPMAGYSIPAAEHNSILAWGRDGEKAAYANMLKQFAAPGSIVAVVSDSYDIYHACEKIWGEALRDAVKRSGATVVIRPDSGVPETIVREVCEILDEKFGSTVNAKGYRVLNHVRIIQGDGINPSSINTILHNLEKAGYAADNVAFGMGGALLQQCNRDTFSFAIKASAVKRGDTWIETFKAPVTDPTKTSKKGRLTLLTDGTAYRTVREEEREALRAEGFIYEVLQPVFENGKMLREWSLEAVRQAATR